MITTASPHKAAREQATHWACRLLQHQNFAILDTETTGLGSKAEIIQVAAVDASGSVLIDSMIKPTTPIEAGAARIHGITWDKVANAKTFDLVFLALLKALQGRELIIYNAAFDTRMIKQSLAAHNIILHLPEKTWVNGKRIWCAMLAYSQFCGIWDYRRNAYKWQKLPGGDHSATGDCRATLDVIRRMAEG